MGYLSLAFLMTLYLQGVRGLSPFDAALLMIPGYILSSVLAPFMGSLSDKFGARIIATIGIALMCVTVILYMTLGITTPLYIVVLASLFAGLFSLTRGKEERSANAWKKSVTMAPIKNESKSSL